ncbi:MAG: hypothetical protein ACP6IY_22490 [Promethearchaeia archaeon]
MPPNFENLENMKEEFLKHLKWFEEEFDINFQGKTHEYSEEDRRLAKTLIARMSEIINDYKDERLLFYLVKALHKIERKYSFLLH